MIELSRGEFVTLLVLVGGSLTAVVLMFVYIVKAAMDAQLGLIWRLAAGSYARAVRELRTFTRATDTLIVQHAHRFPPGVITRIDRESIERLIAAADSGGGPGL